MEWATDDDYIEELEKRIEDLEWEVEELRNPSTSDWGNDLSPKIADIVARLDELLGRGLSYTEAYRLGELIQGFGVERVEWAINQKRNYRNPLHGAYAILFRNVKGKPTTKKDIAVETVRYRILE